MFGDPVTRIRLEATGGTDRYGNPVMGDVEAAVGTAALDPGGTREPVEVGRAQVVTTPKLYYQSEWPDLHSGDRVRVRGLTFEVDGDPSDWRSPWGTLVGGTVVELKAVSG